MQDAVGSPWSKTTAENIIRYNGGTYYLSATVGGKKVRKSLGTKKLAAAKIARDEELEKLRARIAPAAAGIVTLGDALKLIEARSNAVTAHKASTKRFYTFLFPTLRDTLPVTTRASEWGKDEARKWWNAYSKDRSGSQSNAGLQIVRRMVKAMIEAGARRDDPTDGIRSKRMGKAKIDELPTVETLDRILPSIRNTGAAHVEESANMIEFLAWSGLRIGELRCLEWKHVGKDWLTVTGGEQGTKNNEVRRVPISARLKTVIDRMHHEGAAGMVFSIRDPKRALGTACAKAGIPHMRVHDLRHWFATHAIESGVDIPTVAKWLGHKDGGALAMKTYGHIRDDHSLTAIKKMK